MKKNIAIVFTSAVMALGCAFASCEKTSETEAKTPSSFTVVAPDGAPALSIAKLLYEDKEGDEANYEIVDSSKIQTYVTGENPSADACVLPVNLASKLLGQGDKYKMVGSSTHGNLYIISAKTSEQITKENISSLVGKTVGVVNLANVPGLIFKSVLSEFNVEYADVENDGAKAADKVNLVAVDGAGVVPSEEFDYFVVPEPAATTKVNKVAAFNFVGDLQALYGDGNGYVQAVMVVKTSYITDYTDYISDFLNSVEENYDWILSADSASVVDAVTNHLTEGMTPTFTAANLNAQVIKNCNLKFIYTVDCKNATEEIISKFISIKPASASAVSSAFYCTDFR